MFSESTRPRTVIAEAPAGAFLRRTFVALVSALPAPAARAVFWLLGVWSEGTRAVLKHPGSWRALEPFYTLPRRQGSVLERLWAWALDNSRALPERLDIVVSEVTSEVRLRALQESRPVRILSIGSGSARPVLEAAASVDLDVELKLLDIDASALEFSESLANDLGVAHTTRCVANILRLGSSTEQELRDFKPDVVELVGLLDYLNDRLATLMIGRIARFMPPDSVLLVGNIIPNREQRFFEKALKWPSMIYRQPGDFLRLVEGTGLAVERTRHDTYGIHTVVKARRVEGVEPALARAAVAAPEIEAAPVARRSVVTSPLARAGALALAAVGTLVFGFAAVDGLTAPKQQASLNPPHQVFTTQATVDALFPPDVHVVPMQILAADGHAGNVLEQPVLAELYDRSQALRADGGIAPSLVSGGLEGMSLPGFYSIADGVQHVLLARGTSLAQATPKQFRGALDAIFSGEAGPFFQAHLSQHAQLVDGAWRAPALYFFVQADNEQLGGGTFSRNVGGDKTTLLKERYNRSVEDVLQGDSYVAMGIAIDLNLQADEQGYSLPVLGRIAVLILVLGALGGWMLRSWHSGVLIALGGTLVFVWTRGMSHLLGDIVRPSLTTDVILPIALLAFGVVFSLHVIHRMRTGEGGAMSALRILFWSTFVPVAITDLVAFLSNAASPVEAVRSFGIVGAVGVLFAFFIMGICVPLLVEAWEGKRHATAAPPMEEGPSRLTRWVSSLTGARRGRVAIAALVALYVPITLGFAMNLDRGWDVKDFFTPASSLVAGLEERDYHFGTSRGEELVVLLRGDALAGPQGERLIADVRTALHGSDWLAHDPVTGALVEPRGQFDVRTLDGATATQIVVEATNSRELENVTAAREDVEALLAPFGVDFELTGPPLEREAALSAVTTSLTNTLGVGAMATLLILAVAFRSARHAAMALTPVIMVVLGTFAFMRLAGFNLNFVTATVAVIAVGIDYPLYLVCRFRARRDLGRAEAVRRAVREDGWTIAAAAVASAAGFAILATAPMPLFMTYGVLATVMIALSAFWSMLLVPAMLEEWG